MWVDFDVRGQEGMDFFSGGSIIMDYRLILVASRGLKHGLMFFFFLKNMQILSSQDVNWWTGVVWITCGLLWCFYQLFGLSFWRHPFTAEDPLVSKWWNATVSQIWWRKNSSTSWMAWGWVNVQQTFCLFGWTISITGDYQSFPIMIVLLLFIQPRVVLNLCIILFSFL